MPNSCSSENNGCASCAPGLSLWTLGSSKSASKIGLGCLGGDIPNGPFKNSFKIIFDFFRFNI